MSNAFFETQLPSDIQRSIITHFSSAELFETCFATNKALRADAILQLLSRSDDTSRRYQSKFLQAWSKKTEHFQWIINHKDAIAFALAALVKDPMVDYSLRILAMSVQVLIKHPESATSELDEKILQLQLKQSVEDIKSKSPTISLHGCATVLAIADNLPAETIQMLLPIITIERHCIEDIGVLHMLNKVFCALFQRLSSEQQEQSLARITVLLNHDEFYLQARACETLTAMANCLSIDINAISVLLPKIIEKCNNKGDTVRRAAIEAFLAFFKRLPPEQVRSNLAQVTHLLSHENYIARVQASLGLAKIAEHLSLEAIQELLPAVIKRLDDADSVIKDAATSAFLALSKKLPRNQLEEYFLQLASRLNHENLYARGRAFSNMGALVDHLSLETIQALLPTTIGLFEDSSKDMCRAASKTFATFLKKLAPAQITEYVLQVASLLDHETCRVREQAFWSAAEMAGHLSLESIEKLLPMTVERFEDGAVLVQLAASEAFAALLIKLPPKKIRPYISQMISLLEHKDWQICKQACQLITSIAERLPTEVIPVLLPIMIKRFTATTEIWFVRSAAATAFAALLRRLPSEQQQPYAERTMLELQKPSPFAGDRYHLLVFIADILRVENLQPWLPNLLEALKNTKSRPHACQTLKYLIRKLADTPRDRGIRLDIVARLMPLLLSGDLETRQAALEIASFPGILEQWNSDNLPTADYVECRYLHKMQKLSEYLAAEAQRHCENSVPYSAF